MSSAILYIEWNFVRPWFVRSWSYYFCTFSTTVRTNLSYMCSTEVKKKWTTGIRWDTGLRRGMRHGKSVVHSSTGTSRPRSKALKTHLLYRSKSICPQTGIARAPVLVYFYRDDAVYVQGLLSVAEHVLEWAISRGHDIKEVSNFHIFESMP